MALNINVSKNHYYVKKPIEVDVELNQTYPDSYKGGSASNTITISNGEEDRIYGEDWHRFIANCKGMLGVEAGTSIFDIDGL